LLEKFNDNGFYDSIILQVSPELEETYKVAFEHGLSVSAPRSGTQAQADVRPQPSASRAGNCPITGCVERSTAFSSSSPNPCSANVGSVK